MFGKEKEKSPTCCVCGKRITEEEIGSTAVFTIK